jgi:hypothetical protein
MNIGNLTPKQNYITIEKTDPQRLWGNYFKTPKIVENKNENQPVNFF